MLSEASARVVVVGHHDRLAGFGVGHLEAALVGHGRGMVVADPGETTEGPVREMIGVFTCMCARLCGRGGAGDRDMRAMAATGQVPADG